MGKNQRFGEPGEVVFEGDGEEVALEGHKPKSSRNHVKAVLMAQANGVPAEDEEDDGPLW